MIEKDRLIRLVAAQCNLPVRQVELVVNSQFKCAQHEITKKSLRPIKIPFLGMFVVYEAREAAIAKLRKNAEIARSKVNGK